MDAKEKVDVVHILNTHFPTNWKNENLRERVIEFGEAVRDAAIEAAAQKVQADLTRGNMPILAPIMADELRKLKGDAA